MLVQYLRLGGSHRRPESHLSGGIGVADEVQIKEA